MNAMRSAIVAGFAAAAVFLGPSLAQAAQGFIVDQTELKAGPDDQFPTVVEVQAGAEVNVFAASRATAGAISRSQATAAGSSGQDLEVLFQNNRVKIVEVTTVIVPVVTFEVKTYWVPVLQQQALLQGSCRDRFRQHQHQYPQWRQGGTGSNRQRRPGLDHPAASIRSRQATTPARERRSSWRSGECQRKRPRPRGGVRQCNG